MDRQVGTQARDDAVTSGSDTRPPRDLAQPLVVDVADEAGTLLDEPQWSERDRNSRTIATTARMRITLTALRQAAEIGSETTDDTLAVQVLRGRVSLRTGAATTDLAAGQLAIVEQPAGWAVIASEDALLLLTVSLGQANPRAA